MNTAPPSTSAKLFSNVQFSIVNVEFVTLASLIRTAPPCPLAFRRTGRELLTSFRFPELERNVQLERVTSICSLSLLKNVNAPPVEIVLNSSSTVVSFTSGTALARLSLLRNTLFFSSTPVENCI